MSAGHLELFLGFLGTVVAQTAFVIWYLSRFTFKVTLMWNEFKHAKKIDDNGRSTDV